MKSRLSSLCPASDNQMNLFFKLLYGCFLRLYWPMSGNLEKPWNTHTHTEVQSDPSSFDIKTIKLSLALSGLTGQMFSLGVPSSWTIRSTCWISDVPGSKGLWASSSARMQPTALKSKRQIKIKCLHRQQTHTPFLSNVLILINAQSWSLLHVYKPRIRASPHIQGCSLRLCP